MIFHAALKSIVAKNIQRLERRGQKFPLEGDAKQDYLSMQNYFMQFRETASRGLIVKNSQSLSKAQKFKYWDVFDFIVMQAQLQTRRWNSTLELDIILHYVSQEIAIYTFRNIYCTVDNFKHVLCAHWTMNLCGVITEKYITKSRKLAKPCSRVCRNELKIPQSTVLELKAQMCNLWWRPIIFFANFCEYRTNFQVLLTTWSICNFFYRIFF